MTFFQSLTPRRRAYGDSLPPHEDSGSRVGGDEVWADTIVHLDSSTTMVQLRADNLLVVGRNAEAVMTDLQKKCEISKVGEPLFHLGCDCKQETRMGSGTKEAALIPNNRWLKSRPS